MTNPSSLSRLLLGGVAIVQLGGCDVPRDPQSTSTLVRETKTLRLGWVRDAKADEHVHQALMNLQQQTGARLAITRGDSEAILGDLAEGKIDLAYGIFARNSPWNTEVYLARALGWRAPPPSHQRAGRFAIRNGENGWIMEVEKAARP